MGTESQSEINYTKQGVDFVKVSKLVKVFSSRQKRVGITNAKPMEKKTFWCQL